MENKINNILNLVSTNFSDVKFEIVRNSFSPTLVHFLIKDKLNEKGFGTDHNILNAIEKAYSEFIERKVFHELCRSFSEFNNSNGFAAHKTISQAKQSSIDELIERDTFILCWHGKKAPYWLSKIDINKILSQENIEIYNLHKKVSLNLKLGILSKNGNVFTCIAKVDGSFNGKKFFYIDTKSNSDLRYTLNKLIESITYYSHFISKGYLATLSHKKRIVLNQPIDHLYYYLMKSTNIDWLDQGSNHVLDILPTQITSYCISPEQILEKSNLKRKIIYSESNFMQNYYCGEFSTEQINLNRFYKIFGKNIDINPMPHPLS